MSNVLEPDRLLETVSQLPREQFEQFLCKVAARRRDAARPSQRESELLLKITQGVPAETWEAYQKLRDKKDRDQLTLDDEQEIAEVVDQLENHTASRIGWLGELAGLRNQSVTELMATLELKPSYG